MEMISKKLVAIMGEIEAIGKERRNKEQCYNFRGIDDVYNMLSPLFKKHGVITVPKVLSAVPERWKDSKGKTVTNYSVVIEYHYTAEDGSTIVSVSAGEGRDYSDKALNKAMSAAHKYDLIQTFNIPTLESKDSEDEDIVITESATPTVVTVTAPVKSSKKPKPDNGEKPKVEDVPITKQIEAVLYAKYPDGIPVFDSERIKKALVVIQGKSLPLLQGFLKKVETEAMDKLSKAGVKP